MLAFPKQRWFWTISNQNIFFKTQGTKKHAIRDYSRNAKQHLAKIKNGSFYYKKNAKKNFLDLNNPFVHGTFTLLLINSLRAVSESPIQFWPRITPDDCCTQQRSRIGPDRSKSQSLNFLKEFLLTPYFGFETKVVILTLCQSLPVSVLHYEDFLFEIEIELIAIKIEL